MTTAAKLTLKKTFLLPSGSLARQLSEAASIVLRIRGGESLAEGGVKDVEEQDRAAVQDLVYGYLRAYAVSDAVLAKLLKTPLKDLWVHSLLGLAIYRLKTRPEAAHTIVSQAVEAVSGLENGRLKGLVNAVLRNYTRQATVIASEVQKSEEVRWQHPFWWIRQVRLDHPASWEQILSVGNTHPPMSLRVNARKLSAAQWLEKAQKANLRVQSIDETGITLEIPVGVKAIPGFVQGEVSVQDLGAQSAAKLLDPKKGERILDACAAPGGKTAHLLEMQDVDLWALDLSELRCQRIHENLMRLGLQAQVRVADCRMINTWWDGVPFDAVLADVPCTASGVVRRHPDSKWLRQAKDAERFAQTQAEILAVLSQVLRPGGRLLYATCSVFRRENQDQVQDFLKRHPEFRLEGEQQLLPSDGHDGFYYALMVKQS